MPEASAGAQPVGREGWVTAVMEVGWYLPQLFTAKAVSRMRRTSRSHISLAACLALAVAVLACLSAPAPAATDVPATPAGPATSAIAQTVGRPAAGHWYHGVYPGGITGEEDDLTLGDLHAYETAAGKTAAWVYFSNNWYRDRRLDTRGRQCALHTLDAKKRR